MNHRIARHTVILRVIAILLASALPVLFAQEPSSPIGVFEGHQDVGHRASSWIREIRER